MATLIQFLFRASFGLAFGMALTSSKKVTSGYFRNHLFVVLGMQSLAAACIVTSTTDWARSATFWFPVGAVVASYLGSAFWLLERKLAGKVMLWAAAFCSVAGAWSSLPIEAGQSVMVKLLWWLEPIGSGLVLGLTLAAMLLGHWYLNWPGMELAPLRRLLKWIAAATVFASVVAICGLAIHMKQSESLASNFWMFISIRWVFGLLGVFVTNWMAWKTLEIPNTQSATGLLYVSVIGAFTGELAAILLSELAGCPV